jgi:hypothetical protein
MEISKPKNDRDVADRVSVLNRPKTVCQPLVLLGEPPPRRPSQSPGTIFTDAESTDAEAVLLSAEAVLKDHFFRGCCTKTRTYSLDRDW